MDSEARKQAYELYEDYKHGYTYVELEEKYGISNDTIRNRFRELGFDIKSYRKQRRPRFGEKEAKRMKMLHEYGLSYADIGKQYGANAGTISDTIKRYAG